MRSAAGLALVVCALTLNGCGAQPPAAAGRTPARDDWFSDVAERTGLRFQHVNGMSGGCYMTEILASGVALSTTTTTATSTCFSSRADANGDRSPRPAVPQRSDVHADGTRTLQLHRRDRRERHRRARLRHGRRGGRLRQRRLRRSLPHELRRQPAVPQQLRRHVHRRHRSRAAPPTPGLERVGGVRRLRPRRLARSLRRQLPRLHASSAITTCLSPSGARDYCTPNSLSAAARAASTTTTATARSPTSRARARHRRASSGRRSASSTADFNGDGWIDIYVANDGKDNQLWINQRNGTFKNTGAAVGRRR